jgi:hypothetical protein
MTGDMMMPPPMNMDIAMMGPNDTLESMGMNPDGSGGAYESGTMDMGGASGSAEAGGMDAMEPAMGGAPGSADGGGMGAMADAIGGGSNEPGPTANEIAADATDAAMGSAMDGAMDQGGGAASQTLSTSEGNVDHDAIAEAATSDEVDPSAGMG